MGKKTVIAAVLLVGMVMALPVGVNLAIRQGFLHSDKPWAAGAVFGGAHFLMILQQPARACTVMQQGLDRFPDYPHRAEVTFRIAFCYEKTGNNAQAIDWYKQFLDQWPEHAWADQARRHLQRLTALDE